MIFVAEIPEYTNLPNSSIDTITAYDITLDVGPTDCLASWVQ